MPADRIGTYRARLLGRLIVLAYFAFIGVVVVPVLTLLAIVFLVIDGLANLIWNRPAQFGRTLGTAPLRHQFKLAKYALFGEPFPGLLPSAGDAATPA